jgi:hypothetical protein
MCISTGPAHFSETLLYAGEGSYEGKYVHVIAYQNKAVSPGPNAMILPIPAAAELDERNVVDTRKFRKFLEQIRLAVDPPPRSQPVAASSRAKVFDVGSYTVVLARSAAAVVDALHRVPEAKRPAANAALLESFERNYPGWPLAVCCWSGTIEPEPLLWWYEPRMPDWLFAPALDAHDGGPPQLDQMVDVDHVVAFGSASYRDGEKVWYSERPPQPFEKLLPETVRGRRLEIPMPNGDFWLSTADLKGPALRRAPGREEGVEVRLEGR